MNEEVRDKAFEDYKKGMKYKEIAEKYEVSLSAVKSWATRYWKKEGCNKSKKKLQPKKKKVATRGAPVGNQNAVGNLGGAPQQNKNAVKTGEFETIFFDSMDPEEKKIISMVQLDKEQLLLQEIQLLTVRERRMLKRIDNLNHSGGIPIQESEEISVPSGMTVVEYTSGIEKGNPTNLKKYQGVLGQIQSIEDALTRVQARRQRAIEALHRFGFDDARIELETMKFELEMLKQGGQDEKSGDDGFLDAMNTVAADVWGDSDE